ncbi:MAG: GTPase [Calditrichia bacterium]
MPTNLPPEYFRAEERYKAAASFDEKIRLLEELISTIPKHKGTDKLRADLRRRLARLKDSAKSQKKSGGHTSLFYVEKEGAGRVALVGPPNTGKSALLNALTRAEPKIAASPYSTWQPLPGMMEYRHVQIQLIDTPPLSREHVEPELLDLLRTVDLLLIVIDLQRDPLSQLEETIGLLAENRLLPACCPGSVEEKPHSTVIPFLVAVNKADTPQMNEDFNIFCELLEREWPLVKISAANRQNLEELQKIIFQELKLICVYAKPPGEEADLTAPFALRRGATVLDFAESVHKDFAENLKTARIWGSNVYDGQMVGRDHLLEDGDVVELHI